MILLCQFYTSYEEVSANSAHIEQTFISLSGGKNLLAELTFQQFLLFAHTYFTQSNPPHHVEEQAFIPVPPSQTTKQLPND